MDQGQEMGLMVCQNGAMKTKIITAIKKNADMED